MNTYVIHFRVQFPEALNPSTYTALVSASKSGMAVIQLRDYLHWTFGVRTEDGWIISANRADFELGVN